MRVKREQVLLQRGRMLLEATRRRRRILRGRILFQPIFLRFRIAERGSYGLDRN